VSDSGDHCQDVRSPSPPYGYSKVCDYSEQQQIHLVAEFHAHRISPARIAYRTGIDIAFVRDLLSGEAYPKMFKVLLAQYRRNRRDQRLQQSLKLKGSARYHLQQGIEADV
jgi:hypothetical protein